MEKKTARSLRIESQSSQILDWVRDRIQNKNDVPRLVDIFSKAKEMGLALTKRDISQLMRKSKIYEMSLHQQREVARYRKHRPVLTQSLGNLQADIGFFSINEHYATPVTFRAGFLVAIDVLSKFVYIVVLRKNRTAKQIISAFNDILSKHKAAGHKHSIKSVSFDREPSVMSNAVQTWFRDHNISFHAFTSSSNKAMLAENLIGKIRSIVAKLDKKYNYAVPWWKLLSEVEYIINYLQPIVVEGKILEKFTPASISSENISQYLDLIYKANPSFYFSQFKIEPSSIQFKFNIGDFVRAKLIETSAAVLGTKRSEKRLSDDIFQIVRRFPYVRKNLSLGKVYTCEHIVSKQTENFDESELSQTNFSLTGRDILD